MNGSEVVFISAGTAVLVSVAVAYLSFTYYRRANAHRPRAYLYYHNGRRVVKYGLNGQVVRIGRHHDNEIQLQHKSVSRFHAQIVGNDNGRFAIRDMDSRNGLKIFYRPITYSLIRDGDTLFIGQMPMKFVAQPSDYTTFPDTVDAGTLESSRMVKRRRRAERFGVTQPVRFYTEASGWIAGQTRDISEDGMFIQTSRPQPARMPLDIVTQHNRNGRWFKLSGEVVRAVPDGIGVAFTDVDRETKATLYQLCKAAVMNQNRPPPNVSSNVQPIVPSPLGRRTG